MARKDRSSGRKYTGKNVSRKIHNLMHKPENREAIITYLFLILLGFNIASTAVQMNAQGRFENAVKYRQQMILSEMLEYASYEESATISEDDSKSEIKKLEDELNEYLEETVFSREDPERDELIKTAIKTSFKRIIDNYRSYDDNIFTLTEVLRYFVSGIKNTETIIFADENSETEFDSKYQEQLFEEKANGFNRGVISNQIVVNLRTNSDGTIADSTIHTFIHEAYHSITGRIILPDSLRGIIKCDNETFKRLNQKYKRNRSYFQKMLVEGIVRNMDRYAYRSGENDMAINIERGLSDGEDVQFEIDSVYTFYSPIFLMYSRIIGDDPEILSKFMEYQTTQGKESLDIVFIMQLMIGSKYGNDKFNEILETTLDMLEVYGNYCDNRDVIDFYLPKMGIKKTSSDFFEDSQVNIASIDDTIRQVNNKRYNSKVKKNVINALKALKKVKVEDVQKFSEHAKKFKLLIIECLGIDLETLSKSYGDPQVIVEYFYEFKEIMNRMKIIGSSDTNITRQLNSNIEAMKEVFVKSLRESGAVIYGYKFGEKDEGKDRSVLQLFMDNDFRTNDIIEVPELDCENEEGYMDEALQSAISNLLRRYRYNLNVRNSDFSDEEKEEIKKRIEKLERLQNNSGQIREGILNQNGLGPEILVIKSNGSKKECLIYSNGELVRTFNPEEEKLSASFYYRAISYIREQISEGEITEYKKMFDNCDMFRQNIDLEMDFEKEIMIEFEYSLLRDTITRYDDFMASYDK